MNLRAVEEKRNFVGALRTKLCMSPGRVVLVLVPEGDRSCGGVAVKEVVVVFL